MTHFGVYVVQYALLYTEKNGFEEAVQNRLLFLLLVYLPCGSCCVVITAHSGLGEVEATESSRDTDSVEMETAHRESLLTDGWILLTHTLLVAAGGLEL